VATAVARLKSYGLSCACGTRSQRLRFIRAALKNSRTKEELKQRLTEYREEISLAELKCRKSIESWKKRRWAVCEEDGAPIDHLFAYTKLHIVRRQNTSLRHCSFWLPVLWPNIMQRFWDIAVLTRFFNPPDNYLEMKCVKMKALNFHIHYVPENSVSSDIVKINLRSRKLPCLQNIVQFCSKSKLLFILQCDITGWADRNIFMKASINGLCIPNKVTIDDF
jgi:hypothetical protein